jgi:hypothetical protein
MSADEGTIQDNNLGQSSLEPILQEEQESEGRRGGERNGSRASYNNDNRRNSKRSTRK